MALEIVFSCSCFSNHWSLSGSSHRSVPICPSLPHWRAPFQPPGPPPVTHTPSHSSPRPHAAQPCPECSAPGYQPFLIPHLLQVSAQVLPPQPDLSHPIKLHICYAYQAPTITSVPAVITPVTTQHTVCLCMLYRCSPLLLEYEPHYSRYLFLYSLPHLCPELCLPGTRKWLVRID